MDNDTDLLAALEGLGGITAEVGEKAVVGILTDGVDPADTVGEPGIERRTIMFRARTDDLEHARRGTIVRANGKTYKVENAQPELSGTTILDLVASS